MDAKLSVKNGKAQITLGNGKVVRLSAISRDGKKTKFDKFAVCDSKAIATVYATPGKNYEVALSEIGTSANAHKFANFESKGLIIGKTYLAKQGKTIKVH
jgi:hypothetical protein